MSEGVRTILIAVIRLLRNAPMFLRRRPRTPLRVLAIVAFDTLQVVRSSRPLPRRRIDELALVLDFEGWTNAAWDRKPLCAAQYGAARQRLHDAGLGTLVQDYLDRLQMLESRRPSISGDRHRFAEVRFYREEVVRLSLATVLTLADGAATIGDAVRATDEDANVNSLFRLAMQCQVIDDILDYRADLAAGLPSYLTACDSFAEGVALTARAARDYTRSGARGRALLPFRLAQGIINLAARGAVRFTVLRHGTSTTYPGQTSTAFRRRGEHVR